MKGNFDWVKFYSDFADKLYEYKDNRNLLVIKIIKISGQTARVELAVAKVNKKCLPLQLF